jgi:hypothetical protein
MNPPQTHPPPLRNRCTASLPRREQRCRGRPRGNRCAADKPPLPPGRRGFGGGGPSAGLTIAEQMRRARSHQEEQTRRLPRAERICRNPSAKRGTDAPPALRSGGTDTPPSSTEGERCAVPACATRERMRREATARGNRYAAATPESGTDTPHRQPRGTDAPRSLLVTARVELGATERRNRCAALTRAKRNSYAARLPSSRGTDVPRNRSAAPTLPPPRARAPRCRA